MIPLLLAPPSSPASFINSGNSSIAQLPNGFLFLMLVHMVYQHQSFLLQNLMHIRYNLYHQNLGFLVLSPSVISWFTVTWSLNVFLKKDCIVKARVGPNYVAIQTYMTPLPLKNENWWKYMLSEIVVRTILAVADLERNRCIRGRKYSYFQDSWPLKRSSFLYVITCGWCWSILLWWSSHHEKWSKVKTKTWDQAFYSSWAFIFCFCSVFCLKYLKAFGGLQARILVSLSTENTKQDRMTSSYTDPIFVISNGTRTVSKWSL